MKTEIESWNVINIYGIGNGDYNEYIYDICQDSGSPFNSVSTLVLHGRDAAFDNFVVGLTRNASALWFSGGDQWSYYSNWKGSPLQDSFTNSIYSTRPIGGTSAGNAAMPQVSF